MPESVDDVLTKVRRRFHDLQPWVERMDGDAERYRMKPFVPSGSESVDPEDAYTSNLDRVVADKVVYGIASAQRTLRVENDPAGEQRQDANDNAEKLGMGMLTLADGRLEDRAEPTVQDQLAFLAPVRGKHVICRSLLIKGPRGETIVDMLPMDPRSFVFERSARGIEWGCYLMRRERHHIRTDYPDFKFTDGVEDDKEGSTTTFAVYDYYFRDSTNEVIDYQLDGDEIIPIMGMKETFWNGVIIDDKWAKKPENVFSETFPVIVRAIGSRPTLGSSFTDGANRTMAPEEHPEDFGESVFAPNRQVTPALNRLTSYHMAATANAIDPSYVAVSSGGTWTLEKNPMNKASEVTADADAKQEIIVLPSPQTGADGQFLRGTLLSEQQAGGLAAHLLSGQPPPGGISATAMRLLGNSLGERTRPFLTAVASCLQGSIDALIAQYETGRYETLRVFGKTLDAFPFDRAIGPEHIQGHGVLSLTLAQDIPEDDQLKWATAQLAITQNAQGEALASPEYAREHIIGLQDAKLETTKQRLALAKGSAPMLGLREMAEAALRRGEMKVFEYLLKKMQEQEMREALERAALTFQYTQLVGQGGIAGMMAALQGPGGSPNGQQNGSASAGPGPRPEVQPEAARNPAAGQQPSLEAGRNSTAPRPGTQDPLDAVGLGSPRG